MQEGNKGDVKIGSAKSDSPEYLGKVRTLVHEGQGRGFVTHRDIERHIPIEVWDPDTLDNILSNLQELGIEVVEEEARPAEGRCALGPLRARRRHRAS